MGESIKSESITVEADSDFVNRTEELKIVQDILGDLKDDKGNVVFISGEEGIGKSSLLDKIRDLIEEKDITWFKGWCASREVGPYHPFISALEENKRKVSNTPRSISISLLQPKESKSKEIINLMKEGSPLQEITSELKKFAMNNELIFAIEDIHWADKQSLLFIRFLLERIKNSPILLLCTYRPEEAEGYTLLNETIDYMAQRNNFFKIDLDKLDLESSEKLIKKIIGKFPKEDFLNYVYNKTEGNPLFLIELVNYLQNKDDVDIEENFCLEFMDEIDWPKVIEYSIERRSIRLEEKTRRVLQSLSVLGNKFSFDLVSNYLEYEDMELLDDIEKLRDKGFLEEVDETEEYKFTHQVYKDVVYQSLSKVRKRMLHSKAAIAIENTDDTGLEDHDYELGNHFKYSGNLKKAAEYYKKAAEKEGNKQSVCKVFKILDNLIDIIEKEPQIGKEYSSVLEEDGKIIYEYGNRLKERGSTQADDYLKKAMEIFEKAGDQSMVDSCRESIRQS